MYTKTIQAAKHPIFWMIVVLVFFSGKINLTPSNLKQVVVSDGRGYYAYLPAFFIFNDPNFLTSSKVEKEVTGADDHLYLFRNNQGNIHNKYFPGIAVLQAPFFGLACASAWLSGQEINGYSNLFQFFFLLGSMFYSALGLLLFYRCLRLLFPEVTYFSWLVTLIYLATPLAFYSVIKPSFTHLYSFFLFGLFTYIVLKIKTEQRSSLLYFILGITTGLITIVRPTNLIILLLLPFLVGSTQKLSEIWSDLRAKKGKNIFAGLFGFFIILFLLLCIWRWQLGEWFLWSYKAEGFNWWRPKFFQNLFGFRIGLFVHTPLLILSLIGTIYLYKTNRLQFLFWWIYFIVNTWVISAWWCWDYESTFGNRPLTEHIFFLILPLFFLLPKAKKWIWIALFFFTSLGLLRLLQYTSGQIMIQRFSVDTYFNSLQFWKSYPEKNRFSFTRSVEAYGKIIEQKTIVDFNGTKTITAVDEFSLGGEAVLKKPRTNERYHYRLELDKKITTEYLKGVHFVVDATSNNNEKRFYMASELFNDRYEGTKDWKPLIFEGLIMDNFQEFDHVKLYIWNQGRQTILIKNVKITITKYKAD